MKRSWIGAIALLLLAGFMATGVIGQDKKKDKPKAKPAPKAEKAPEAKTSPTEAPPPGAADQAAMEAMAQAAAPGPHHKFLEQLAGSWEITNRIYMAGPDGPALESKSSQEQRMILGGRFLQGEVRGELMGMTHEGQGTYGYDNVKRQFVATWLDNTSTALLTMRGSLDQTGKILTLYGTMDDAMTGERDKMIKYVLTVVDENTYTFGIFDLVAGENYKVVESTYTRRK